MWKRICDAGPSYIGQGVAEYRPLDFGLCTKRCASEQDTIATTSWREVQDISMHRLKNEKEKSSEGWSRVCPGSMTKRANRLIG